MSLRQFYTVHTHLKLLSTAYCRCGGGGVANDQNEGDSNGSAIPLPDRD